MAKSNKQQSPKPANKTAPNAGTKPASLAKSSIPAHNWLDRPPVVEANSDLLKKIFYAVSLVGLLVLVGLSLGSGINADDKFQNDYSVKLVNYYSTFGKDSSALFVKDGNMHLYGGFFEVITGFTNKALSLTPNDHGYHDVRHAWSAFFGWVAMFCGALLAAYLAGWRAGIVTFVIMICSPRLVGDSLMNPKDIPFAAGYIMALYNMVRVLDGLPKPSRWHVAGLAGGLAIGLATRAGGLLPFAYLFMFAGLHFLLSNGLLRSFSHLNKLGRYAAYTIGIAVAGYILAILFWPFALQSPISNPLKALSQFSALEVRIRVLFEGTNVMSDKSPWNYPVKWIVNTIPLAALVGFIGSFGLVVQLFKRYNPLWISMIWFAAIFPVAYIIYKDSVIHDGWRHITFAYPAMVVAAGLFWNELANFFNKKVALQAAVFAVMGALLVDAGLYIVRNPAYPYTYFNPLKGGIKGAYGQYETDYWGVSVRQGLEWLEKEGILSDTISKPIVIATNMAYSAQKLTHKYGDKVKIKYLKWEKRYDDAWDYGLFPTRFLEGTTLRKGKWPPDNTIHTIDADGVPLMAILKDDTKNCTFGMAALKLGDVNTAITRFQAELEKVPDNEIALGGLAQAHLNLGQSLATTDPTAAQQNLDIAKAFAEKTLEITPDDSGPNNIIGLYWIELNDVAKAKAQFELSIRRDNNNPMAYYYMAIISQSENDDNRAVNYLTKTIQTAPTFKQAYEMLARIYEKNGNTANAQKVRNAMPK